MKRYRFVPAGGGTNYDWARDHTFVKVSSADTGGVYSLMEDNLKREFSLGLHLHRHHAETFYILDGTVGFYIDGDWLDAPPATTIHIPPGISHAVTLPAGQIGKMLMIFQPSGFDQYLEELAAMTQDDLVDAARMRDLELKHDIVNLGPVPARK
jgi:quercetin dioxygenase-like cupin family protein